MQRQTGQGALGVLSLQLEGSLVGWRSSHGKYGARGSYSRLWVQEMGHLDQQHQGPRRTPAAHSSPPLLCPAASPDALDSTPLLYQLYLVSLQVSSLSPHMRSLLPVCVPAARVPFQKANLIKLPPSLTPSNSFFLPGGMRFNMLSAFWPQPYPQPLLILFPVFSVGTTLVSARKLLAPLSTPTPN